MPKRGSETIFHPLGHLQPIKYCRPATTSLGLGRSYSSIDLSYPSEIDVVKYITLQLVLRRSFFLLLNLLFFAQFNARLAAAEEALALSIWTTATVCRALSLESVIMSYPALSLSLFPIIKH